MIDVHCHLNFHPFHDDIKTVIQHAKEKGVTRIINTGTSLSSSEEAVKLAEHDDMLYAIIGIHPHHADKVQSEQQNGESYITSLRKLAAVPKVIGIGEIGLDFFSYKSNGIVDPQRQKKVFLEQLALSHTTALPLQIHNRHAGEEIVALLVQNSHLLQSVPGMFHCFSSTKQVLHQILDMGFYVGFDGNITYPGLAPKETVSLTDLALATPLERIVCETDSPYLAPVPFRGKRNEPAHVILVAQAIAKIKRVPLAEVIEQTTKNVYTIFRKLK